jgi:hypothetical protein
VARLLPLLLFAGLAIFLMIANQRRSGPVRDGRAWRPGSRRGARATGVGPFVIRPGDVAGVRDAYSGAAINPSQPLVRCANCMAYYHSSSADVLVRDNRGRCASCGSGDFRAVVVDRA